MKTVLVASSKGGVGKTTIATHLAAQSALDGHRTVLIDADPQRSSTRWAERRSDLETAVLPIDGTRRTWLKQVPDDTQRTVIDAPAGATADSLEAFLEHADALVVPVLPSTLDIDATVPFLNAIAKHPRVRRGQLRVGLVGNRLKPWQLRDSQAYVMLVGLGRSLFDYHSQQVREHQEDWAPLLKWLKKG
jgi:chromosome partitioning protein